MALKVVVTKGDVLRASTRTGVNDKGRAWSIRSQPIRIFTDPEFPEKFVITLPEGVDHYSAGEYLFDLEAHLDRGNYDALSFVRSIVLQPAADKTKAGQVVFFVDSAASSTVQNAIRQPFIPKPATATVATA